MEAKREMYMVQEKPVWTKLANVEPNVASPNPPLVEGDYSEGSSGELFLPRWARNAGKTDPAWVSVSHLPVSLTGTQDREILCRLWQVNCWQGEIISLRHC